MPKMKTHKGAAKRFRITRTGKVLRMKAASGHNKQKKTKRTLRRAEAHARGDATRRTAAGPPSAALRVALAA